MRIVLHADDLGLNRAVTAGVIRGFRRGLLTSAALLANAPHAAPAVAAWRELAREHAERALPSDAIRRQLDDPRAPFDLGVHLNLTQGRPLTGGAFPEELLDEQGLFLGVTRLFARLVRRSARYAVGIEAELAAQISFTLDHGLRPGHLNGHQSIELFPVVDGVVRGLLERFSIRVVRVAVEPALSASKLLHQKQLAGWLLALTKRGFARRFRAGLDRASVLHPAAYFGTAHAGRIDARLLKLFLSRAPRADLIEIGLHPALPINAWEGEGAPAGWSDALSADRPSELALLESADLPRLLTARRLRLGRLSQLTTASGTVLRGPSWLRTRTMIATDGHEQERAA